MNYTYEQYRVLYKVLAGITTHFIPAVGTKPWHKLLYSRQGFEKKMERLEELESHDTEWLFKNRPDNPIDVAEGEMWEMFELRSDLFVIELERHEKIQEAMEEVA